MLFTEDIGIEEIINQIMFGFITKSQHFVLFLKDPQLFLPDPHSAECSVFLLVVASNAVRPGTVESLDQ
jgi:hypothetical protein